MIELLLLVHPEVYISKSVIDKFPTVQIMDINTNIREVCKVHALNNECVVNYITLENNPIKYGCTLTTYYINKESAKLTESIIGCLLEDAQSSTDFARGVIDGELLTRLIQYNRQHEDIY